MFVVAPVVAVGVATVGFVLANHYDAPRPDDGGSPLPALSLHLVGPACSAKLASQLKTGGWDDLAEQGKPSSHGGAVFRLAASRVRRRSRYSI
jgi:hypothetical protein